MKWWLNISTMLLLYLLLLCYYRKNHGYGYCYLGEVGLFVAHWLTDCCSNIVSVVVLVVLLFSVVNWFEWLLLMIFLTLISHVLRLYFEFSIFTCNFSNYIHMHSIHSPSLHSPGTLRSHKSQTLEIVLICTNIK